MIFWIFAKFLRMRKLFWIVVPFERVLLGLKVDTPELRNGTALRSENSGSGADPSIHASRSD